MVSTVHPCERRARKIWNLGNYFLLSQTHLSVVILTANILSEVIALLREILGKYNKIKRSGASFFATKHAIYSRRRYVLGGLYGQAGMQVATERERERQREREFMS